MRGDTMTNRETAALLEAIRIIAERATSPADIIQAIDRIMAKLGE